MDDDDYYPDGGIDPTSIDGEPVLENLARAVRQRDWAEADRLIDRIADAAGADAQEQVAKGRAW